MDSADLSRVQQRARVRYEVRRALHALLGVLPMLVVIGLACSVAHRPMSALVFGVATAAVGAFMLWYGRDPQRAVLPGIAAGMVPLVFALCANRIGHVCTDSSCMMMCLPACTLGGVVAGLAVASVGNQRRAGLAFWLSASGLALLTGAMGCSCIGYAGVAGLAVGYVAGLVPTLLRRLFRAKSDLA